MSFSFRSLFPLTLPLIIDTVRMKWIAVPSASCHLLAVIIMAATLGTTVFLQGQQHPLERRDVPHLLEAGLPNHSSALDKAERILCQGAGKDCTAGSPHASVERQTSLLMRRLRQSTHNRHATPKSNKGHGPQAKSKAKVYDRYYDYKEELQEPKKKRSALERHRAWVIVGTVVGNLLLCCLCISCGPICGSCKEFCSQMKMNCLMCCDTCRGRDIEYRTLCRNLDLVDLPHPTYHQYLASRNEFVKGAV